MDVTAMTSAQMIHAANVRSDDVGVNEDRTGGEGGTADRWSILAGRQR